MIETIPQDALVGFAIAQGIALSAEAQIGVGSRLWGRPFQRALLFHFLVFLPVSYSYFHNWPDWSWLYVLDPSQSMAYNILGFLVIAALAPAGFALAHYWLRTGRRSWPWATLGTSLACAGAIAVAMSERFFHIRVRSPEATGPNAPFVEVDLSVFGIHTAVAAVVVGAALFFVVRANRMRSGS